MNPTIIKRENVRLAESVSKTTPGASSAECATAGVRVHETEGQVKAIEVTCSCGETTVIELEYSSGESSS